MYYFLTKQIAYGRKIIYNYVINAVGKGGLQDA